MCSWVTVDYSFLELASFSRMNSKQTKPLFFDTCQIGVVLRALLLVEAMVSIGVMLTSTGWAMLLERFTLMVPSTLSALLLWLISICALKTVMQKQARSTQWAFSLMLGFACGLVGMFLHQTIHASPVHQLGWLASGLLGLLFAWCLMTYFDLRDRARQPAATVAKLAELQSRIRPHFLFNTLNSAIALVREDPGKAERMLEDLSDLFHHALKDPNSESSLEKEVSIAKQYLNIEQIRFGERLQTFWEVDESALQASVPPLILQPLVENAIKHGIEPCEQGGSISVQVLRKGASVFVHIRNPVAERHANAPSTAGNGIALDNVRSRLRLLHDMNVQFKVRRREGVFEVGFVIPAAPITSGPLGRAGHTVRTGGG